MALSEAFVRKQLALLKPLILSSSLSSARLAQETLGELMQVSGRFHVRIEEQSWQDEDGRTHRCAKIEPKDRTGDGVIVYLHGGGYACGGPEFAKGFGTALCEETGLRIFCADYRLAPEHPFPAAIDDVLEAYRFLLRSGLTAEQIVLCGESAGGGLCYALCLRLRALGIPLPAGIIGISPWVDLTMSGDSVRENEGKDLALSHKRLCTFAECYGGDPEDPLVSPLFADLRAMPPSLLFAGGDEILLSDATRLCEALHNSGCDSSLIVTPHMWHAYPLYRLKEHQSRDALQLRAFLARVLPPARKLRWMKLDNAAKIFPASRRRHWTNVFRLSADLTEQVDPRVLQSALDVTARRFPSVAVRIRRGVFWYYLEEIRCAPRVRQDCDMPLQRMPFDDIRHCAFRVLYYQNRIAVEFFHAVTDGTGGLIFLKSLLAEYLTQRYRLTIPAEKGVLDRLEEPREGELEDSFLRYSGDYAASRRGERAYDIKGELEPDRFLHLTCGRIPTEQILSLAKQYGVSLTVLLAGVMVQAIDQIQREHCRRPSRYRPIKIALPVNLRKLFPSETLRNFVLVTNVGINPREGEYTLPEILTRIKHQMGIEITPQHMRAEMTVNVNDEKNPFMKVVPLFLKNWVMRLVFDTVGEVRSSLSLSNLGAQALPEPMQEYVTRLDFIIGTQSCSPYNCGVIGYGDEIAINIVRNTVHPELEHAFFTRLVKLGLKVTIESNQREDKEENC